MRKLFVITTDARLKEQIKDFFLAPSGFRLAGSASDIHTALRLIRSIYPDLVILDDDLPPPDFLQVARIIEKERLAPILLLSSSRTPGFLREISETMLFGFASKPVTEATLLPALRTALLNYEKLVQAEREIAQLKKTLKDRKLIEQAKGLLMKRYALTEDQAYKQMRRQSMDKCVPMEEVAQAVIVLCKK